MIIVRRFIKSVLKMLFRLIAFLSSSNRDVFSCSVNGYSRFTNRTVFGRNNHFNGCKVFGKGKVTFGDNFHSATNLRIFTSYHNYLGSKIPYDNTLIIKDVLIEDNVWIGMDVIVLAGVTIGEGSIIQAGSVVVSSIPKLSIAGGNPAKVFKMRDSNHYYKHKTQRDFF